MLCPPITLPVPTIEMMRPVHNLGCSYFHQNHSTRYTGVDNDDGSNNGHGDGEEKKSMVDGDNVNDNDESATLW